jgi:hypothetical protein
MQLCRWQLKLTIYNILRRSVRYCLNAESPQPAGLNLLGEAAETLSHRKWQTDFRSSVPTMHSESSIRNWTPSFTNRQIPSGRQR